MSRDEVWKMIDEVDDNKDGRLDYGEVRSIDFFCFYQEIQSTENW